ncbi:glycosyltransferase [Neosynechococcus sphagnicola]|uniref:glycosyltransferase n=1 Tax=Neosynechococcus sphagnicola TaxID=1501145 RepID=UPI0019552C60|nr:glycosyltransferase [Neosynechococcus sphagnicola]
MIYFLTVNYESTSLIAQLLDSIAVQGQPDTPVIIVNNSPDDPSVQQFQRPPVKVIEAGANLGFGRACNLGLRWVYQRDPTAIVWLINPDAGLHIGSLDQAQQLFHHHPEISILGTVIYQPDGRLWFAGGQFTPRTGTILSQTTPLHPSSGTRICDHGLGFRL